MHYLNSASIVLFTLSFPWSNSSGHAAIWFHGEESLIRQPCVTYLDIKIRLETLAWGCLSDNSSDQATPLSHGPGEWVDTGNGTPKS
uniref:Uncharacterized protein n=1 Tax=Bionectria ochroleuca TaxID=29856 RepID=A0A0B7JSX2_BIOOC